MEPWRMKTAAKWGIVYGLFAFTFQNVRQGVDLAAWVQVEPGFFAFEIAIHVVLGVCFALVVAKIRNWARGVKKPGL